MDVLDIMLGSKKANEGMSSDVFFVANITLGSDGSMLLPQNFDVFNAAVIAKKPVYFVGVTDDGLNELRCLANVISLGGRRYIQASGTVLAQDTDGTWHDVS